MTAINHQPSTINHQPSTINNATAAFQRGLQKTTPAGEVHILQASIERTWPRSSLITNGYKVDRAALGAKVAGSPLAGYEQPAVDRPRRGLITARQLTAQTHGKLRRLTA